MADLQGNMIVVTGMGSGADLEMLQAIAARIGAGPGRVNIL